MKRQEIRIQKLKHLQTDAWPDAAKDVDFYYSITILAEPSQQVSTEETHERRSDDENLST